MGRASNGIGQKQAAESLEKRLAEAERKVAFMMKIAQATIMVGSRLDPQGPKKMLISFENLYKEMQREGAQLVEVAREPQDPAHAVGASESGAGDAAPGGEAAAETPNTV